MNITKIEIREETMHMSDIKETLIIVSFENLERNYIALKQPFDNKQLAAAFRTFAMTLDAK